MRNLSEKDMDVGRVLPQRAARGMHLEGKFSGRGIGLKERVAHVFSNFY